MVFCVTVQARAKIETQDNTGPLPATPPSVIYVSAFSLDAEATAGQDEKKGILGRRPGLIGQRIRGDDSDPATKAAKLSSGLQQAIIASLSEAGIDARPEDQSPAVPQNAWLVNGEFLEVDEGQRARRAVIGFGAGKAEMETQVLICDLNRSADEPFVIMGSHAQTGRAPGAILLMNPYVLAAKFVLSKNATEKETRKTGRQIAQAIQKLIAQIAPEGTEKQPVANQPPAER